MTSYYDDLNRIKAAGLAYANTGIAYGSYVPEEGLFSGEWTDGLTGQDVLDQAGIEATFSELEDFEQTDVMDYFEDGYYSAAWPGSKPVEYHEPEGTDPLEELYED